MEKMKKKIYFGLVDAFGIESFIEYNKKSNQEAGRRYRMLEWRAQANSQRNAIVYKIKLSEETIEIIEGLMKKELFIKAGQVITMYLDKINGTKLTETNKHLLKIQKLRGYL